MNILTKEGKNPATPANCYTNSNKKAKRIKSSVTYWHSLARYIAGLSPLSL